MSCYEKPAQELYKAFSEFKPDFLYGMKPAVVELALYILENDRKIKSSNMSHPSEQISLMRSEK